MEAQPGILRSKELLAVEGTQRREAGYLVTGNNRVRVDVRINIGARDHELVLEAKNGPELVDHQVTRRSEICRWSVVAPILDVRDGIGIVGLPAQDSDPSRANRSDCPTPIGKLLGINDLCDATDVRTHFSPTDLGSAFDEAYAKLRIALQTVADQLAVARFEDVELQDHGGQQHRPQREHSGGYHSETELSRPVRARRPVQDLRALGLKDTTPTAQGAAGASLRPERR